jgi:phage shock protein A
MKRLINWFKAIFNRGMDKLEDPEIMLDQARREMTEALSANRERAVQAITQKNRLQSMLTEQEAKSADLEAKASMALKQGNRDLARQFIREKQNYDSTLESLRASHAQATETVESVKLALRRQEEDIRRKTSEALALKAQWKQSQIQNAISKTLDSLNFENEFESQFGAAREKIKDKMAESQARQELFGTSVAGKTMQMEDMAMDGMADEELLKLEQKLGLVSAPQVQNQSVPQVNTDVDAQLAELEKRIENQQQG